MIPARFQHLAFALVLSGMMSSIVSGISTLRALGLADGIAAAWMSNWLASWAVAFPAVTILAPVARRLVARLVIAEPRG